MIRVRKAQPSDARAVVAIERNVSAVPGLLVTWPHEVSHAETRHFVEQARRGIGCFFVAEIAWARRSARVRKIELLVRASNRAARKLYRNFGFQVEGRLRQRVRLSDGSFVDDLSMAWFPRR